MPGAKRSDEKGSEMVSADSRTPKARCSKMLRVNLVRVRSGVRLRLWGRVTARRVRVRVRCVRVRVRVMVRVRVRDVAREPSSLLRIERALACGPQRKVGAEREVADHN